MVAVNAGNSIFSLVRYTNLELFFLQRGSLLLCFIEQRRKSRLNSNKVRLGDAD